MHVEETLIALDQGRGEDKKILAQGGQKGPAHEGLANKGPAHKGPDCEGPTHDPGP